MTTIEWGDVRLAVEDRGRGPLLLLVHGFPLDHTMWNAQLAAFAPRCRVLAPDLPGFGASEMGSRGGTEIEMRQYADDLGRLVERVAPGEKIVFCGLSMGGYIAWQFLAAMPERLAGLVLCDTRAVADSTEAVAGRRQLADQVRQKGPIAAAEAMEPKFFGPETVQNNPHAIKMTRDAMLRASSAGIIAALGGMASRPDMTGALGGIQTPTLVMVGEHDRISTPDEMRGIAATIPGADFSVIPRSGHMSPLENPTAFNATLSTFLSDRLGWPDFDASG